MLDCVLELKENTELTLSSVPFKEPVLSNKLDAYQMKIGNKSVLPLRVILG